MITHQHTQPPTVFPFSNRVFNELNRYVSEAIEADQDQVEDFYDGVESISNDEDGWKLRFELPGYKKEEVKISLEEGFLHILAETEDDTRDFLGSEKRRVKVTDDIDVENITARLEEGILYLQIPRKVKPAPKEITVN